MFSLAWFQFDLESVRPSRLFLDSGEVLPGICTLMLLSHCVRGLFCRHDGHHNPESVLSSSLAWFQFDPESVRRSRIPDPAQALPGICTLMFLGQCVPSLFCRYDGHPHPESVLSSSLAWFQFDTESVRRSRPFPDLAQVLPGICTLMLLSHCVRGLFCRYDGHPNPESVLSSLRPVSRLTRNLYGGPAASQIRPKSYPEFVR